MSDSQPDSSSTDRAQSAAQQLAAYRRARAQAAEVAARLEGDLLPSPTTEAGPSSAFIPATPAPRTGPSPSVATPPPPPPPPPASQPSIPVYSRGAVTVADLRGRTCWICAEGDDDEEADDEDSIAVETGADGVHTSRRGSANRREKRWIHPCICSLIAHESCILKWIRSRRRSNPTRPITCPQCSTPYLIIERRSLALRFFQWWDAAVHVGVPAVSAGFAGGAVLIASTAYSCAAIRAWMGPQGARRILGGKWPWHYYFDIPLVPFAIVASRLRILDRFVTWLPTLIAFPMTGMPLTTMSVGALSTGANVGLYLGQGGLISRHRRGRAFAEEANVANSGRRWPPSPALTILLVPWVRALYHLIKRRVTRYVLSPFVKRPSPTSRSSTWATSNNSTTSRRRRVIVVGRDSHLVEVGGVHDVGVDANGNPRDVPPGAEAVSEIRYGANGGARGETEQTGGAPGPAALQGAANRAGGNDNDDDTLADDELARIEETAVDDQGRDANERHFAGQETIYVSPHSMARMCIGALSMPFISSLAGAWLAKVAKRYGWLARFLGMEIRLPSGGSSQGQGAGGGGILAWLRSGGAASKASETYAAADGRNKSTFSSSSSSSSPISRLFSGGGGAPDDASALGDDEGALLLDSERRRSGPSSDWDFDDVDPAWFRNALGLGLVILVKDALQLAYRFERLRHERMRDRIRVGDLPFGRNMVESPLRLSSGGAA